MYAIDLMPCRMHDVKVLIFSVGLQFYRLKTKRRLQCMFVGEPGISGGTGSTGSPGLSGDRGDTGPSGVVGWTGTPGSPGQSGRPGWTGPTGERRTTVILTGRKKFDFV